MKKRKYPNRNRRMKDITPIEKIKMRFAGRNDGKRGLPRELDDGSFSSPFLQKEACRYDEYSTGMWCDCQMQEEAAFTNLQILIDTILQKESQLHEVRSVLEAAEIQEEALYTTRRMGESRLTEGQVISRRKRESERKLAPLRAKVSALEDEIEKCCNECTQIYDRMIELHNTTRMICRKTNDHVLQRIAVYWDSMLKKHPDKNKMPVIPTFELSLKSENVYMALHESLMHCADELIKSISNNSKKEAA